MRGTARAAARRPRVGLVNGASRSVVEDRLVHVERLVEPAEAVASPDPLEDRPGQIGARYVGIREIGSGEVGADQQHLAQVDRKSTRLNSSHSQISYAVFCLQKKKDKKTH